MNISQHLVKYINQTLKCNHIFTLTGGGAMFLNDAVGNEHDIKAIYCHHEQACAMAAVGYAKLNGIGVCVTTTGCGATNTLTGLLDAWQDNVPVLFISGNVKSKETTYLSGKSLRSFGVQEFNIIPVVTSFTKAAYFVDSFDSYLNLLPKIKNNLLKGRPGPIWIDIPMDIQSYHLDELSQEKLKVVISRELVKIKLKPKRASIEIVHKKLEKAKKPVFLVGNGLRLSNYGEGINFLKNISKDLSIPIVTTYLGVDFFKKDENYFGPVGLKASRVANLILNNSDLIICIGTRLATSVIGFEYELFANDAFKIIVDIDSEEHTKKTINPDLFIHSDAYNFLLEFQKNLSKINKYDWLMRCYKASKEIPIQEQFSKNNKISIYDVVKNVCRYSNSNDVIVSDAGSSYYVSSIMFERHFNQRYITSGAQADMGFALPAGIGCAFAKNKDRIHIITGDGSIQLNIQELQTIFHYKLNISIYILNNNGYLSIRTTQKNFFTGRECGTDQSNGISFPDFKKIAFAYNIKYEKFNSLYNFAKFLEINKIQTGPIIYNILCPEDEAIIPKTKTVKSSSGKLSSAPLTRMAPDLSIEKESNLKSLGFNL